MSSSCPTAAPAAPCARAWPTRSTGCCDRDRPRPAAVPAHRARDQRPGGPGTHALHALRRRLSRSLAAARPRRDDDRCRARRGHARSLSRGRRAGRRGRSPASDQDRHGAGPGRSRSTIGVVEPARADRRCGRRGCERRAVRRLAQGTAAATASGHGGTCPRHLRPVCPLAAADDPARLCHGAGRAGARSRREAAARQGPGRVLRPAGGPAAIHAVQHTLYPPRWLERWPDSDQASRLVFIVRDLEPDEILRRFADGEPACLAPPAGVT